jgi:glycosyltransferase involved in cell wall biosynthesis
VRLDVIVPTYNRYELLKKALASLFSAPVPESLEVQVTVVDNNSNDRTVETVGDFIERAGDRVRYIKETRQGRSSALNAGIEATEGELVGMIDDDEEIDRRWYHRIRSAFQDATLDFIGGPYVPRWGMAPPSWLPGDYGGVIGNISAGDRVLPYDHSYPGILMGGNAVVRRAMFRKVGLYNTALGRTDKHLQTGEDDEMYRRLLAAGARGLYLPDLIIYHYVPPERLTKQYFRKWCFWHGVSMGAMNLFDPGPRVLGLPRWMFGRAARGIVRAAMESLKRQGNAALAFSEELPVWDLAGSIYGKYLYSRLR